MPRKIPENLPVLHPETKKRCTKCKDEKSVLEFGRRTASNDGLAYWCKACRDPHRRILLADVHRGQRRERRLQSHHERFLATVTQLPNGCSISSVETVRLANGAHAATGRAVWAFAGKPEPKGEIRRLCRTHRCVTDSHLVDSGRRKRQAHTINLTAEQRQAVWRLRKDKKTWGTIARRFNISTRDVKQIFTAERLRIKAEGPTWFNAILKTGPHKRRGYVRQPTVDLNLPVF